MHTPKVLKNKVSPKLPQLALILQDSSCKWKLLFDKVAKSTYDVQIIKVEDKKEEMTTKSLISILK